MERLLFSIVPILFSGLCFSQTDINLTYQSLLGGNGVDSETGINRLSDGNFLISGYTESGNLEMIDEFQTNNAGNTEGYVAIINPEGQPVFTSYLGGSGIDIIESASESGSGNIVLAGTTRSEDFPLLNDDGTSFDGFSMGFLTKIDPEEGVIWSTLVGGTGTDNILSIDIDNSGDIYLVGTTSSPELGTSGVYQTELTDTDQTSGFIAKYSSGGEKLWYSYVEGLGSVNPQEIQLVEETGTVVLFGYVSNSLLSGSGLHQQDFGGGFLDCLLMTFDMTDGSLNWFTYYGGEGIDGSGNLCVDTENNIYISGNTSSTANISSIGSHQEMNAGSDDLFIAKFDIEGNRLWATYYGAGNIDANAKLALSGSNGLILGGRTRSEGGLAFGNPILNSVELDPIPPFIASSFLSRFDQDGNLIWSTYAPENYRCGSLSEMVISEEKIYLVGRFGNYPTLSECYGTTPDAFQSVYGGGDTDMGIFIYTDNTLSTSFPQTEPLSVYPNPASDFITIEIPDLLWAGMELTVTDLSGRLVDRVTRFQSGNSYATSHLSNGVYILTGRVGDRLFREKVVINH